MMRHSTAWLFILSLLVAPLAYASKQDQQINAILEQTGFNKLVQYIPTFAQSVLKQSSGALEPEMNSALSVAFDRAFSVDLIQHDINALMNAHYSDVRASAYLKQLQSPLHTRMAELERSTTDPANREDATAFKARQKRDPASAIRIGLIEQLDNANRTTSFSIDLQSTLFKAVFTAIEPVLDPDMRLGEGELEKMVTEVRTSLADNLRQNTRHSYLYAFRDISDAELEQYIKLCESDTYSWGIQLLGNAMIAAINQAAERAAQNIQLSTR